MRRLSGFPPASISTSSTRYQLMAYFGKLVSRCTPGASSVMPRDANEYHGCIRNAYPYGGTDVSVPGSNGGPGIYQRITPTISKPPKRPTPKKGGFFGAGDNHHHKPAHWGTLP